MTLTNKQVRARIGCNNVILCGRFSAKPLHTPPNSIHRVLLTKVPHQHQWTHLAAGMGGDWCGTQDGFVRVWENGREKRSGELRACS